METESKSIREELQMDLGKVIDQRNSIEIKLKDHLEYFNNKLASLQQRIAAVESVSFPNFNPETTVVAKDIKYAEDILVKSKDLISNHGLGLALKVKNAMRIPFRNDKSGTVVKTEFQ